MKIFIDTNSYLNSYGISDNISLLIKLKKILTNKDSGVELIATQQVLDEYYRNIGNRIEQSRDQLKESSSEIVYKFSKSLKDIENKVKKDIVLLTKKIDKMKVDQEKAFEKRVIRTEKLISQIFSFATIIPYNDSILEKSKERYLKGNPPRKRDSGDKDPSYGDAINWETILSISDKNFDLFIISTDLDYAEKVNGNKKINRFLENEWKKAGGKSIKLLYLAIFLTIFEKEPILPKEELYKEIINSDLVDNHQPFELETFSSNLGVVSPLIDTSSLRYLKDSYGDATRVLQTINVPTFHNTLKNMSLVDLSQSISMAKTISTYANQNALNIRSYMDEASKMFQSIDIPKLHDTWADAHKKITRFQNTFTTLKTNPPFRSSQIDITDISLNKNKINPEDDLLK